MVVLSVSIAILAGGRSRRLGTDKAVLRFVDGGPTMLERTAAVCAGLSDDLFVIAPNERGYADLGLQIVADRFPGEGPAGGVITALETTRYSCCLVLGCDYPFLARPLLRWLVEAADPDRPVVPQRPTAGRQGGDSTLEVLHAVYPVAARSSLEAAFAAGERQLAHMVMALTPRLVSLETLLRFDPGLRSFRSINRPEDAAWAHAVLSL
jgi:molybdopterin-guanine dinucleotide biosynthesis protein A